MANYDGYLRGTDETGMAYSAGRPITYTGVVDLALIAGDPDTAYTSLDVIRLVEFEAETIHVAATIANITALDIDSGSADSVDFGNTISSASDPDDYVNASSNEATTAYSHETAAYTPSILSANGYYALRITGDKMTDGTATGKIGYSITVIPPARHSIERSGEKTYTNE